MSRAATGRTPCLLIHQASTLDAASPASLLLLASHRQTRPHRRHLPPWRAPCRPASSSPAQVMGGSARGRQRIDMAKGTAPKASWSSPASSSPAQVVDGSARNGQTVDPAAAETAGKTIASAGSQHAQVTAEEASQKSQLPRTLSSIPKQADSSAEQARAKGCAKNRQNRVAAHLVVHAKAGARLDVLLVEGAGEGRLDLQAGGSGRVDCVKTGRVGVAGMQGRNEACTQCSVRQHSVYSAPSKCSTSHGEHARHTQHAQHAQHTQHAKHAQHSTPPAPPASPPPSWGPRPRSPWS